MRVASELGVSEQEVEAQDEYAESITSRIISSLQAMQPAMFAISAPFPDTPTIESYQEALDRVVQGAVATGHEGVNRDDARNRIQIKDQDRMRYLQTVHHQRPDDAHLYDITLSTSMLSLDEVVDLICRALEHKAERLSVPTGELGPAAGLARYPGTPSDFHPPTNITEQSRQ